ncbi:hypothetical protein K0M31_020401 [Melipona bicolor]|uniref:Uncharacterized protein n=1 Tax=Melipona bicolor TaxID=60889 RepID=A0AA40G2G5_9HYME|nr:hypothetical protein K0M31_020401 [Melipona bicolor]
MKRTYVGQAYLRLERLPSDKRPEGSQRRFHESYRQAGRPKDGMWLVTRAFRPRVISQRRVKIKFREKPEDHRVYDGPQDPATYVSAYLPTRFTDPSPVFTAKTVPTSESALTTRNAQVLGFLSTSGRRKECIGGAIPTQKETHADRGWIKDTFVELGVVTSIEYNHKPVESARKGQEVCVKIEPIPGEAPKMFGRHFDEKDFVVSKKVQPACVALSVPRGYTLLLEISRTRVVDRASGYIGKRVRKGFTGGEDPLLFVQRCTVSDKGWREGKGTSRREDEDETTKRKRDREREAKNSTVDESCDKQTEYRRLQGILQGRFGEDRLAADGRTEKALPDTLGHARLGENVDVPTTVSPASEHRNEDHDQRGEARKPS